MVHAHFYNDLHIIVYVAIFPSDTLESVSLTFLTRQLKTVKKFATGRFVHVGVVGVAVKACTHTDACVHTILICVQYETFFV